MAEQLGTRLKSITVYCGASNGKAPVYAQAARALGEEMSNRGIQLVYGGGNNGLMGEIARTVASKLGASRVIGVIPPSLEPREVSGEAIGQVISVKDIHERKAKMSELADAFIALPGGYGTLEELLEMITWQQLGFHTKPVGVLNIDGFYNHLLQFVDSMVDKGFVRPAARGILLDAASPGELIDKLQAYKAGQALPELLASESRARDAAEK